MCRMVKRTNQQMIERTYERLTERTTEQMNENECTNERTDECVDDTRTWVYVIAFMYFVDDVVGGCVAMVL